MPQDCCHDQKKQRQRHPPPPFPPRPARIIIHRHKIPGRPPCSRPLTLQIPQTTRIFFHVIADSREFHSPSFFLGLLVKSTIASSCNHLPPPNVFFKAASDPPSSVPFPPTL